MSGFGGVLSFVLRGDYNAAKAFFRGSNSRTGPQIWAR
jgi:hypothetical protein